MTVLREVAVSPVHRLGRALRGGLNARQGSVVAEGVCIRGGLRLRRRSDNDGRLSIFGDVLGDVVCADLFLGPVAHIVGDVHVAGGARIEGRIVGNVKAAHIALSPGASVQGAIHANSLLVGEGAAFTTSGPAAEFALLEVHGDVTADARCSRLVVGATGRIDGDVQGRDLVIDGTIHGRVEGDRVTLAAHARVLGDIVYRTLAFEQGAQFEGRARRAAERLAV